MHPFIFHPQIAQMTQKKLYPVGYKNTRKSASPASSADEKFIVSHITARMGTMA